MSKNYIRWQKILQNIKTAPDTLRYQFDQTSWIEHAYCIYLRNELKFDIHIVFIGF